MLSFSSVITMKLHVSCFIIDLFGCVIIIIILQLILSVCLAVAVTVTVGQETGEDQGDGRGADRANRECNLFSGCKDIGKELFKIKDKIDGLIGIKKTIKNSLFLQV